MGSVGTVGRHPRAGGGEAIPLGISGRKLLLVNQAHPAQKDGFVIFKDIRAKR